MRSGRQNMVINSNEPWTHGLWLLSVSGDGGWMDGLWRALSKPSSPAPPATTTITNSHPKAAAATGCITLLHLCDHRPYFLALGYNIIMACNDEDGGAGFRERETLRLFHWREVLNRCLKAFSHSSLQLYSNRITFSHQIKIHVYCSHELILRAVAGTGHRAWLIMDVNGTSHMILGPLAVPGSKNRTTKATVELPCLQK